ncbi:hypothetical protein MUP77_01020 [Candidatus Bathyarchaeota archaeon]|nr:hypothetical protein [Candidatus Bathyarchaeota archaeon]
MTITISVDGIVFERALWQSRLGSAPTAQRRDLLMRAISTAGDTTYRSKQEMPARHST